MAYRLPPLKSLRLFEAAGRLGSFKLAAEELFLTPSAVSHGIQALEQWLGLPLFLRGHRSLTLTEEGIAYLAEVRQALDILAAATDRLAAGRPRGRLAVTMAPSFGLRWLLPRLPGFRARYPQIDVSVDTAFRLADFPRDGFDCAIRMGRGGWPGQLAAPLVTEQLVPVCAPALAAEVPSVEALKRLPLLHVTTVTDDWAAWLGEPPPSGGLRFDTINMALEAAARGLGIALGRLPLVADDLAAGRLVAVLGPPRPSSVGYWFVTSPDAMTRPEVAAFHDWLRQELAE